MEDKQHHYLAGNELGVLSNELAIGQQMLTASSTFMAWRSWMQHEVKLAKPLLSKVSPSFGCSLN